MGEGGGGGGEMERYNPISEWQQRKVLISLSKLLKYFPTKPVCKFRESSE